MTTRITKMVDLSDVEVDIELDSDDLAEVDSQELWEALERDDTETVAELICDNDSVQRAVLEASEVELLRDALLEKASTDQLKETALALIGKEEGVDSSQSAVRAFLREQLAPLTAPPASVVPAEKDAQRALLIALLSESSGQEIISAVAASTRSLESILIAACDQFTPAFVASKVIAYALTPKAP
jgi:hypothetical protein